MTEVFLYENVGDRNGFLEKLLLKKILPDGKRAVVLVADRRQAKNIDAMLWSRSPESFLPHCVADCEQASRTPVLIAVKGEENPPVVSVLVNCCDEVPEVFASYMRLVEILPSTLEDDPRARERVKEYESRGHKVKIHNFG